MPLIYLNNAATSHPKAPGVSAAVARVLERGAGGRGRGVREQRDTVEECRAELARLLDVSVAERIVLTSGATHALNLAIAGLGLRRGERVVTTAAEHNSVLRPLRAMGLDLTVARVEPDGRVNGQAFDEALRRRPALVAVNHASNVTGCIQDAAALLGRAKEAGAITLLDASQTAGHLELKPAELNADLVAFTGHKGLLGPAGTGGLYVSPALELTPLMVGGTGVRSDLDMQPPEMPVRLEAGTPNTPGLAGLLAGVRWLLANGKCHRDSQRRRLAALLAGLREMTGVMILGPREVAANVGIVSLRFAGWPVEDAGFALRESFGIECRTGLHCAPLIHAFIGSAPDGTLRLSVSGFTTDDEIRSVLRAVETLARRR